MTNEQRAIAEAAIDRRQALTYEGIREEVSKMTGFQLERVRETLVYLSKESVIRECATPAHDMGTGPIPPDYATWGWYEKGEMWPK